MAGRRGYDDPCGIARALDVVGDRWALLVVRELVFGPKRFGDLTRGLPGMSPNVLSQRLRELEQAGIVRWRRLGPPVGTGVYELTTRGQELEDVLLALARWGSREPLPAGGDLSVDALVLALKTTFDPAAAGDLDARYELAFGDDRFHAEIVSGRFWIARGPAGRADALLDVSAPVLRDVMFAGRPIADAVESGDLRLTGDVRAAERLVACFPRPATPSTTPPPTTPRVTPQATLAATPPMTPPENLPAAPPASAG
ncbi:winged helix-turn-helix transcriptional regulator [Microbispora corallina]|uniref:Transcriptional regulator n=1 Tax=Microbispora corallina TaxID=83302 RepID=A0ABQ4G623_9ACTN|nr:winged helix-turn-helix transcriptional regulator [Microbispora corallina]GIH42533.1 transcriptional regulator [Microbispora corallina]